MTMISAIEPRIVVGIDGSPQSLAALRWALREAATTEALVDVVHCWQPHTLTDMVFGSPHELHRGSICMLDNEVTTALAKLPRKPHVRQTSKHGRPAHELLQIAMDAQLLVLGAHGHTELRDLAFGRVAASCLRHASCPVVIVGRDEAVVHRRPHELLPTPA